MRDELDRATAEREAELASERRDYCEKSRQLLQRLQASDRVRIRAEDGTERIIGEDERQQRITDAKDGIVANCEGIAAAG